jgi:hypothetical protein
MAPVANGVRHLIHRAIIQFLQDGDMSVRENIGRVRSGV